MELNTITNADALEYLKSLPDGCVDCVVTSPPYYGLRDYGVEGQYGREPSIAEYVANIAALMGEVKRVLKPTGTCFFNVADSYGSGELGRHDSVQGRHIDGKPVITKFKERKQQKLETRLPAKSLLLVPERLAIALQDAGWIIRNQIIWHKPNPMPESVKDRFTRSYEVVFFMVKSGRYYFDAEAVSEPMITSDTSAPRGSMGVLGTLNAGKRSKQDGVGKRQYDGFNERYRNNESPLTRNKRDVWTLTPANFTDRVKSVRHIPVSVHELSGGTKRKASLNCPVHGSKDCLDSIHECDEHEAAELSRIAGIYARRAQEQSVDCVPTAQNHASDLSEQSSSLFHLDCVPSAIDHNTQTHKTGRVPATTLPYTPSDESASRTDGTPVRRGFVELHHDNPANNTSQDAKGAHSPDQTGDDIVDTLSSVCLPCTCQFYREETQNTSHFATFPEDLITPMILAGCPVDGVVLDPFMGSGTTALVARKHNRNFIGCELNPEYIELINKRLAKPYTAALF